MRIRCPSCSATYEVPAALVDQPRTVRCAKCAHDWTAVAEPEPPAAEAPLAEQEPEPADAPEAASGPIGAGPDAAAPFPEEALGDTPLSGIERLQIPANLSPGMLRHEHLLTAAWAASFAIVAALGVAWYTERNSLMRHWPATRRVYAVFGLAHEGSGPAGAPHVSKAGDTTPPHGMTAEGKDAGGHAAEASGPR